MKSLPYLICLIIMGGTLPWVGQAQSLTDIGGTAPTPGAYDIAQLSTAGNQTDPDGLNYYTDNQTSRGTGEPGQTFTAGTNAAGYVLSAVAIKTAGLGSDSAISTNQPYYLHLYSVSGGNVTLIQTYTSGNITFKDGDWLQWTGLSAALSPGATYAYSFGKASSTNGWEALAVASGNRYAGGEIGLFPPAGGAVTLGGSHAFDAVFDLQLAPAVAPGISGVAVSPMSTVLVGTPVTFTASVVGAAPLIFQWQFNSGGGYVNLPGVGTGTLGFTAALTNTGSFQLILVNSSGAVTSAPVTLTVLSSPSNEPDNDNLIVYDGQTNLNNGWQNWSYGGASLNFANPSPVTNTTPNLQYPGSYSFSANLPNGGTIQLEHDPIDATLYTGFTFWANGGASGGQYLQVAASNNGAQGTKVQVGPLPANAWQQYTITLSALGMANATGLNFFTIINSTGSTLPVFYLEGVSLNAKAPPATVHVGVNALKIVRAVDARVFGLNAADWDGYVNTPTTLSILTNINNQVLRWPGGSGADVYFMSNPNSLANTKNFLSVATNTHSQVYFTVNYGTGTPEQAAAWVAFCNITNHCGFKYWEVGNESGGTWETDTNTNAPWQPHDPWTYAIRFKQYYDAMKAVDPTIIIGSSADVTEDGTANYNNHPVVNPRTGVTHNGWTPVMLYTMKTNGCICDFLIDHTYGPGNSDMAGLLSSTVWGVNSKNLRQMLTDYLGTSLGAKVELNATENGSGGNDRQLVSLVSGLYWADSLGQILQTEINTRLWWDLRNGQSDFTPSDNTLYGWRKDSYTGNYFGDLGIVAGLGDTAVNRYPAYYCGKLMKYFAVGGDTVVTATNDYKLLATYAVQRTNGWLTLLVINKSCYTNLNAAINLTGFVPVNNAVAFSYGSEQDMAASLNGPATAMDIASNRLAIAGTNFTTTFPPYTATVLEFAPAAVPPMVTSTAISPSASVYSGQNALLSASATGPAPLSYQWQFGNGVSWTNFPGATTNSVVVNPLAVGTIYYQLTVTNLFGSVTNAPVSVQFNALPATPAGLWTASFQITNNLFQNVIVIGIGSYVGRGILGSGNYWNIIPDLYTKSIAAISLASVSDLLDDGVTHSGISVNVINAYGFSSLTSPLAFASDIGNLLDQYVQVYTSSGALTFSGVTDGNYNLALYGVDGTYADRGTTFVVHDLLNGNHTGSTLNAAPPTALAQGNNFVLFTNVHVVGGTLTVDINPNPSAHGGGNTEADFNAAQIQFVSYDPPVAGFSGAPTNLFVTQTVIFTNTSTGIITNSAWNFGDGNFATNSSTASVSHNYANAGSYTVSLTISGPGGTNTAMQASYIVASPSPTIASAYLSGGSFILSGSNAPAGAQYLILASTNLALPLTNWMPVVTNRFAPDGSYSYTNASKTNTANFFRLVSP